MNAHDRTTIRRLREALENGGQVVLAGVSTEAALLAMKAVEGEQELVGPDPIAYSELAEVVEALVRHYSDYEFKPTVQQALEMMVAERNEKKALEDRLRLLLLRDAVTEGIKDR